MPQRGWLTVRITPCNHIPLEERPPWFSTKTLMPCWSPNLKASEDHLRPHRLFRQLPELDAFTRMEWQPKNLAAVIHGSVSTALVEPPRRHHLTALRHPVINRLLTPKSSQQFLGSCKYVLWPCP